MKLDFLKRNFYFGKEKKRKKPGKFTGFIP